MTPREFFESNGKLFACPNPPHNFSFWKIQGSWRLAKTCWSSLSEGGKLHNNYFHIGTIESQSGIKCYNLILWRLALIFKIN